MPDRHLTQAELTAWRDEGAGDRARLMAHLAACSACREMAADVERARPAERIPEVLHPGDFIARGHRVGAPTIVSPWSGRGSWLAAAAAAVIVIALVPWPARDDGSNVTRGDATSIALVRPVETAVTAEGLTFEWSGAADGRVRLNVVNLENPGEPLIEREVTGLRYEPTSEERQRFRPGQTLHWYVEVLGGFAAGHSPSARFSVR